MGKKEGDPAPKVPPPKGAQSTSSTSRVGEGGNGGIMGGFGVGIYALMMVGGLLAYGAWKYLGNSKQGQGAHSI